MTTVKKGNPLLEPKEIERRLGALKDGYASNAIENNPLTQDEKIHLENMVKKGLTDDEMIQEIAKDMSLVEEVQESTKKDKSSLTKSLESAEKFLSEIRSRK